MRSRWLVLAGHAAHGRLSAASAAAAQTLSALGGAARGRNPCVTAPGAVCHAHHAATSAGQSAAASGQARGAVLLTATDASPDDAGRTQG